MTVSHADKGMGAWTRREFISAALGTTAAAGVAGSVASGCASLSRPYARNETRRKQIVLLATEVRTHSHAQHFIDRFLEGYGWQGRWHHPSVELVSLYVDQFPDKDLVRDRSRRFNVPIYPTIEEALTRGGSKLAVDGVVIIGEHGKYPRNEKGQTLYPRYKWFKQVVKLFEENGRAVPVFNDKHLATTWSECAEMVADSKRLGFPFLAGSSLPVTWRIPSIEMPLNTPLMESVCVCYGGVDSYDFHGFETAQCMSERRLGGEAGVKSIQALRGKKMWDALADRETTLPLFFSALARSHTLRVPDGYTVPRLEWPRTSSLTPKNLTPTLDWVRRASAEAVGYFIEHNDGFRTTMILANGLVQDFTYAGRSEERSQTIDGGFLPKERTLSCQMHLPMPLHISTTADFFNPQINSIEQMIVTGRAPYPVERTLLTSGLTLFGVESLHRGQMSLPTPDLAVAYRPSVKSTFWQA